VAFPRYDFAASGYVSVRDDDDVLITY
jgi:hypothetical protein